MNIKNIWTGNKDKSIRTSILLILFILLASTISALGVAPSREIGQYITEEQTFTFRIMNNEHKDMNIRIFAQGDLAQYVTADKTVYSIKSTDDEVAVTYKVKLPSDLKPGLNTADIVALETTDESINSGEKTLLLSAVGVSQELRINVPYPGKYVEGTLYVSTGNVNDSIIFSASIINKGKETIDNIKGELVIKGPTNEELYRVKAESVSDLLSGNAVKMDTAWKADVNPGMYLAEFVVDYDGKVVVLRNSFVIGNVDLEISKLGVGPFKIGAVAEFNLEMINRWNQPLDNAYGELQIMDQKGNQVESVKINTFTAQAMSTANVNAYWNTKGVDIGNYDILVRVYYSGKTTEKMFKTIVGIDSINVLGYSSIGNVVADNSKSNNLSLVYILIIGSIIFNIVLFTYFKYIRKKIQPPSQ